VQFTFDSSICSLVKSLGMRDPLLAQSMYIFKQPKIGGYVSVHQDNTFVNTKPLSCMALWFAVDDVSLENGCLWFVPGSHKEGITTRFKRNSEGDQILFTPPDQDEAAPWSSLGDKFSKEKYPELWVSVEIPRGSLVVVHGNIVHMSEKNTSSKSRHAYTFHMVEGDCLYSSENWLQRPKEMPFLKMIPQ